MLNLIFNQKFVMNKQLSVAEERGNRLKMLISMSGLEIIDFADLSGTGVSTLRNWINGRASGLSEKGAKKVVNFVLQKGINCNLSWLLHGVGPLPRFDQTARGEIRDSDPFLSVESNYKKLTLETKMFLDNYPNSISTVLEDDSMEPFYKVSEHLGGILLEGDKIKDAIGKDCIIVTEEDGILVRRLAKGEKDGIYTLFCLNPGTTVFPPVITGVRLKGVAPILRIWRP